MNYRSPPPELFRVKGASRFGILLTEAQFEYLYSLMSIDEGEHAETVNSAEFSELEDIMNWFHTGIHGPSEL